MAAVLEENDDYVSVIEGSQTTKYRRATRSGKIPDISQLRDVLLLGEVSNCISVSTVCIYPNTAAGTFVMG